MYRPKTLQNTIMCIMGVPLLCMALLLIYFGYQEARKQGITNLVTVLTERTTRQASELNLYFGQMSRYPDTIASILTTMGPQPWKVNTRLLDDLLKHDAIRGAIIAYDEQAFTQGRIPPSVLGLQKNGQRECSIFSKRQFYDYAYSDWFLLPKLSGAGIWTDPFYSSVQKQMICSYSAPFFKNAIFQGAVSLSISVDDITRNLQHINMQGSQLMLLSQFGTIVVHPNSDFILRHTFVSLAKEIDSKKLLDFAYNLRSAPAAGVTFFDRGIFGDNEYIAYATVPHSNWVLLSAIPESKVLAPLMGNVWRGVLFVLIGSTMVFLMGYWLSAREIILPLQRLEQAAKKLAQGKLDTRVQEGAVSREILSMERTFNLMVSQLGSSMNKEIEAGRARSYAEEASRAKTDFLARMSHEIRTPMNAILGLTHLALEAKPEEKQQKYLLKIRRASKSMLGLINDILDFSKIEAGMLVLERIPFSLHDLVKTLEDLFDAAAAEKGLTFAINIDPALPTQFMGDPLRLTQVLMNLCNNALKFTQEGSITVSVSALSGPEAATFALQQDQGQNQEQDAKSTKSHDCVLKICITDTGIGISEQVQVQLFNKFTQADSTTTRKFGGTGLGLAICKLLVNMMQGSIKLQSSPGAGSTFTVLVPFDLVPRHLQITEADSQSPAMTPDIDPATRILVAEDNEINQEIICALLANVGLQCHMVSTGKQAVDALEAAKWTQPYDLVLMDIQMPEMDGLTATRILREKGFTMPVLAMTANAMETDKELCQQAGMNAHIAKPIEPTVLYMHIALWAKTPPPTSV